MNDDLSSPTPNPASMYDTPRQLAEDQSLSIEERCKLLDQWEDDVRIRLVASEEGMTGPNARVGLADILEAKASLPLETRPRDTAGKA